ncbi:MAG: hypothetical protein HUK24_05925 [Sphaerochaetaceae bacterium]|nr:hypothetical protein [Sphaerochaetaceae bacterium]
MKASTSAPYFPGLGDIPSIRRNSSKFLCEIENILTKSHQSSLPLEADIDGDSKNDYIIQGKNIISYLSPRGGVLNRVNFLPASYDLEYLCPNGLFIDSFILNNGKTRELSNSYYDITSLDKRRTDFVAQLPELLLNKNYINLTKRFKFRQNILSTEIEFENLGNNIIDNIDYCCTLEFALPFKVTFCDGDNNIISNTEVLTQNLCINDEKMAFSIYIALGQKLPVTVEENEQMCLTSLGEKLFYRYTSVKIRKNLSIGPSEEDHLTIGLKVEGHREKI